MPCSICQLLVAVAYKFQSAFDVFDVFDTLSSKEVRCWKLWFWTDTSTGPLDHRPHFPLAHCLGFRRAWRVPKGSVLSPQHTKSSTRWAMATWQGGNELRLQSCSRHHGMWKNGSKVSEVNAGKVDVYMVVSVLTLVRQYTTPLKYPVDNRLVWRDNLLETLKWESFPDHPSAEQSPRALLNLMIITTT